MHADRGHFHHRLIDMGLSQKQAVAVLYSISGILGLAAVLITTSGEIKALIVFLGFCLCAMLWAFVYGKFHKNTVDSQSKASSKAEASAINEETSLAAKTAEDDNEAN